MAWGRRNAPVVGLGAAILASAVLLVVAQWGVTYFQDTWAFLLDRQVFDARAFFVPHNEHLVAVPVAITKLLLAVFGMTSNVPEQVAMALTLFAVAILLFVYVRRRTGARLALIAATLFLFLGSAWSTMIWPFENGFTLPLAFGIATLLLLERGDRRGDAGACLTLALAILSGSLGVVFGAAVLVDLLLERRQRGWGRAYALLVPLGLYLAWYAGWGHEAEHHLTLHNVLSSPLYVAEGFAASLAALTGLSTVTVASPPQDSWGPALLVGAVALVILAQRRRPGVRRTLWPVLAAAIAYWALAAFNFIPGREATQGRYIYAGAAFVLLIAAELLRSWPLGRRGLIVAGACVLVAILPNLARLEEGSKYEREQSAFTRADLAALEIAREHVPPEFTLGDPAVAGTPSLAIVQAGKYFEAVDRWGSPAYTPAELERAPAEGRHYADLVLASALGIASVTEAGAFAAEAAADCVVLEPGKAPPEVKVSPGKTRVEVAPGGHANVDLRRFATDEYPVKTVGADGESTLLLTIPADSAPQPWYVHVEASQLVRVCG